ncbi:WhiB family transcriptional regulator [Rhodococcus spongiicola]|uniref:Transcriptional regulator WhiB n=1 Tax=Rhodococcus spongiicola TaxID=2487352 RepID=A0A3S3E5Z3_9NOCA|nr:WhiB family transcriptional regulator [Rhodococcus spongiicola]RVW06530.1 WhiB family transcriptional regulator [Rhodococcus spongiicola]
MNNWRQQAACREDLGHDPELWFPDSRDATSIARAVNVCRTCPVIAECRSFAKDTGQKAGIWAGQLYGTDRTPDQLIDRATHCPNGHRYTPENTQWSKRNTRRCRACMNARSARIRAGEKAGA